MTHLSPQPAVPLSVWPVTQQVSRIQRTGRYLPESTTHPAKMLPALARHAISVFTAPEEVVFDPMCGIGTTLVEATHLGRHGLGVEVEPRWADLTATNLAHARTTGATGTGEVFRGDARHLPAALTDRYTGRVALLLTSPPYGSSVHGRVRTPGDRPVVKWNHKYSPVRRRTNLAHQSQRELLASFTSVLRACLPLLRPGGIVVVTARPWRSNRELVDLPASVFRAGVTAGLQPVQRCVALLAAIREGDLVTRASFFQLLETRRLHHAGIPAHVIAHEDVLILRKPPGHQSTPELKGLRMEPVDMARALCRRDAPDAGDAEGLAA
ncbi:MAG TPA: DNA methyltransferase [Mycobacteriales bacterium]|nr:DNA methyltransferase [Mycobacteriales bacterium]